MKILRLSVLTLLGWAAGAIAQVSINPTTVDFGLIETGASGSGRFELQNQTSFQMKANVVSISPPFSINNNMSIPPNQSRIFDVFLPNATIGAHTGTLVLKFEAVVAKGTLVPPQVAKGLAAPRSITLKATAGPRQPAIQPSSLDFGAVAVGQTKSLPITIKNPIGSAVTCQFASDPLFTMAPPQVLLGPVGQGNASIVFQPTQQLECSSPAGSQILRAPQIQCGAAGNGNISVKAAVLLPQRFHLDVNTNDPLSSSVRVRDMADPCRFPLNDPQQGGCEPAGVNSGGCVGSNLLAGHSISVHVTSTKPFQYIQCTGSAAVCNGRTTPDCAFTMTQPSLVFVKYAL